MHDSTPKAAIHPRPDDKGRPVQIREPSTPNDPDTWERDDQVAVFVPAGPCPPELNGVPLAPWTDAPTSKEGWNQLAGEGPTFPEPPLPKVPPGKHLAAGAAILEPDGRVWLVHPTNKFGGYTATFCKGTVEPELGPRATAIKEALEESGLRVQIVDYLADVPRSTSITRYYLARRTGGTPTDMGWESQSVSLVPVVLLGHHASHPNDKPLVAALHKRTIA